MFNNNNIFYSKQYYGIATHIGKIISENFKIENNIHKEDVRNYHQINEIVDGKLTFLKSETNLIIPGVNIRRHVIYKQ